MSEITKKTIEAIKKKKIEPQARWRFQAKNTFFWLILAVTLAAAAMAVATIIFFVYDYDWDVYTNLNRSFPVHVFYSLPYFWLAVLIFFLALAYFDFRSTKRGYCYDLAIVLGGASILSIMAGTGLFFAGLDSQIDDLISRDFPPYESLIYDNSDIWSNADLGLLGGRVVEAGSGDYFVLRGEDGQFWQINGQNASWVDSASPIEGMEVKLIGRRGDDHLFFVETAREWKR